MTTWSTSFPGLITPGCGDVDGAFEVHRNTGIGFRVGGEARLCFTCGPDGGVYHPDIVGLRQPGEAHWPTRVEAMARLRALAKDTDRHHNRFGRHQHHTFVDGRDGANIVHSHTDGSEPHRHPETAGAWFGHRGEGVGKPTRQPDGEQRPFEKLPVEDRTFRVVLPYQYFNGQLQNGITGKPSEEWTRASFRRSMDCAVAAIRLRALGHDYSLYGSGAIEMTARRLENDFGLIPIYEIPGWTPTFGPLP